MKNTEMLKKNYEFKTVLSKGTFYLGEKISIVILKNHKKINLLGIAISTKNGKAFQRNRLKRYLREAYQNLESKLLAGNSIVFLMNKKVNIEDITYQDVLRDMTIVFEKAKMIKKEEEKNEKI